MDLITQVVNSRYPINTKCMAKIAKIEGQRAVLRKKITMAMVTDFKVKELSEKVIDRIKRSWLPDQPYKSKVTAMLVNSFVGGTLAGGVLYDWFQGDIHWFNIVDGKYIDVCQSEQQVQPIMIVSREGLMPDADIEAAYEGLVNRYMQNFMEEIK